MTSKTSDDDVQYYICEKLTLEREKLNTVLGMMMMMMMFIFGITATSFLPDNLIG